MGLDLRLPIGLLFLIYGLLLAGTGIVRPQHVQELNVNLIWGAVLIVFGTGMLMLARRSARSRR